MAASAYVAYNATPAAAAILVDDREPEWVQQLHWSGVPVVTTRLAAGDLHVACADGSLLVIERKTATDLLSTLKDDRLYPQIIGLREASPWAYLLVTGTLRPGPNGVTVAEDRVTGWNWASVAGALLDVQEMGVGVVQVAGDTDLEAAVLRLAARSRESLRIAPPREAAKIGDAEAFLTGLPGIGVERAVALLDYCTSAGFALQLLSEHPEDVPTARVEGIGAGLRKRARAALGLKHDEVLAVVSRSVEDLVPRTCVQCGTTRANCVLHLCAECFDAWRQPASVATTGVSG